MHALHSLIYKKDRLCWVWIICMYKYIHTYMFSNKAWIYSYIHTYILNIKTSFTLSLCWIFMCPSIFTQPTPPRWIRYSNIWQWYNNGKHQRCIHNIHTYIQYIHAVHTHIHIRQKYIAYIEHVHKLREDNRLGSRIRLLHLIQFL